MSTQATASSSISPATPPRVLVWYEGNGDTFFRISERIATWLARDLSAGNIAVALTDRAECLPRLRARGHTVFPYAGPRGVAAKLAVLASLPGNWLRFGRILDEVRPDVVILTSNFALAPFLVGQIRKRGIRLVYLPHDPMPHTGDFLPQWQKFAQDRVLATSHHLVFLSDAMRDAARTLGGRFTSLPASVTPLHSLGFPVSQMPRAPITGRPVRFLFLGRMIRYKGLDLLCEACRLLAHRTDWQLTLAGGGPEVAQVRADFAGLPQVDASRLRYLEEYEIDTLNLEHDVLICPYRDATQSGAVAEATLTGLPSIVTPVGALPAQVDFGAAGWVTADVSAAALARTMAEILDHPETVPAMSAAVLAFWARTTTGNPWMDIITTTLRSSVRGMPDVARP